MKVELPFDGKYKVSKALENEIIKYLDIINNNYRILITNKNVKFDEIFTSTKPLLNINLSKPDRIQNKSNTSYLGGMFFDRNKGVCFEGYYSFAFEKKELWSSYRSPSFRSVLDLKDKSLYFQINPSFQSKVNLDMILLDWIYIEFGNGSNKYLKDFRNLSIKSRGIAWKFEFPNDIRNFLGIESLK